MNQIEEEQNQLFEDIGKKIKEYKSFLKAKRKPTNVDLVSEINRLVWFISNESNPKPRLLALADISKIESTKIPKDGLRLIAEYFGCSNAKEIVRHQQVHREPIIHPGEKANAIASDIRQKLTQLIGTLETGTEVTDQGKLKALANSNPKAVLECLFQLPVRPRVEGQVTFSPEGEELLTRLASDGEFDSIREIVEECIDTKKLRSSDICNIARDLANRACLAQRDAIDDPDKDLEESKNFERSRSQIVNLEWPKPYRGHWLYVERSINALKKFNGSLEEFFQYQKTLGATVETKEGSIEQYGSPIPATADNFAFLYDPMIAGYLGKSDQFLIEENEIPDEKNLFAIPEWKAPSRMYRALYLSLVRAIRRKELLGDVEVIGVEAGLTEFNKKIRLRRCRFSSIVGTHYTAGVSIFSQDGDQVFDGLSHISQDRQWYLLRTQLCPNVVRVSTLVVTEDDFLVVFFGPANSLFTQKSWQPPISGFITYKDFEAAKKKHAALSSNRLMSIKDVAKETIRRKMVDQFSLTDEQIKDGDIETVGIALDVLHGRIPTLFALTKVRLLKDDIVEDLRNRRKVHRIFDLVRGYPQASYLELLESSAYQDAELLKANLFFALLAKPLQYEEDVKGESYR